MMPGIGLTEMILLVVVSIIVIGPKDLPLMMRKFGKFTGQMRALAFEFKQGFDELGRQAELDELRQEVEELKKNTGVADLQRDLQSDRASLEKELDSALAPDALPAPETSAAPPGAAPGTVNGAQPPPIPNYPGLSAEHPGYETGEDPLPDPAPVAASEPAKQDTPA